MLLHLKLVHFVIRNDQIVLILIDIRNVIIGIKINIQILLNLVRLFLLFNLI